MSIKSGKTSFTERERKKNTIKPLPSTFSHQRKWCQPVSKLPSVSPDALKTQETSGADKHNDHNTWVRWIRSLSSTQHPRVRKGEKGGKRWRNEYRGRERGDHFNLGFLFHFLWTLSDNKRNSRNVSLFSPLLPSALSSTIDFFYFFPWSLKRRTLRVCACQH